MRGLWIALWMLWIGLDGMGNEVGEPLRLIEGLRAMMKWPEEFGATEILSRSGSTAESPYPRSHAVNFEIGLCISRFVRAMVAW